jgi:deoxycytidine triphosphate deaminase
VSVLSDGEIRDLIASAQMIENALDGNIFACSYEFRPGVIVPTGSDSPDEGSRDWTGPTTAGDLYPVKPGELVWVRTIEKVSMPTDICASWWQTNRLSRQGLMLVNMSMVEPGYQGPLACLFVNFGKRPVILEPDTVIAKLVFNRLGAPAQTPLHLHETSLTYDRKLFRSAMDAPVTFLDVGTIYTSLHAKRDSAIAEMDLALDRFKRQLSDEAETVQKDTRNQFEKDTNSLIRRVLGAAAIGFVLVVLAMTFVPWLQANFQPSLSSQIQRQINDSLTQRIVDSGSVGNTQQLAQLEQQVQQLQQELHQLQPSANATSRK